MECTHTMKRTFFVCDKCGTVDSVYINPIDGTGFVCTECKTGMWHNFFTKRIFDEKTDDPNLYINTAKPEITTDF